MRLQETQNKVKITKFIEGVLTVVTVLKWVGGRCFSGNTINLKPFYLFQFQCFAVLKSFPIRPVHSLNYEGLVF